MEKPLVLICSWCQKINDPHYSQYANQVDPKIREELNVVDQKVKENKDHLNFTHAACPLHLVQSYKEIPGMTEYKLKLIVKKAEDNKDKMPQCLITNEEVRHAFMNGLFTPELVKQYKDNQQKSNDQLTERFRKLGGIYDYYNNDPYKTFGHGPGLPTMD